MTRSTLLALAAALGLLATSAVAQSPGEFSDTEIAHVAYTADAIDIRYAHLAMALSDNPQVRAFAETMIRDHTAVNEQALALLDKLGVSAEDNFLSQQLNANAATIIDELSGLRGVAFDRRYAGNELAHHQSVISLVADTFLPNIDNAEVKALFEAGLEIFRAHEGHAAMMVETLQ